MACSVIRNKTTNKIEQVLAPNGENSILYKSFLDLGLDPENALGKWALVYTPTFKNWFGDWEKNTQFADPSDTIDKNGEPVISIVNNTPVFVNNKSELKHATENIGSFVSKDMSPLIEQLNSLYKLTKTDGTPRNIGYGASEIAERIEKRHPGVNAFVATDIGGDYITLDVSPHLNPDNIMHQFESSELEESNAEIDSAMYKFFDTIGVDVEIVDNIRDKNGNILNAVARANMLNRVVDVVMGKAGIDTLPEEAAHFFVELLEANGNPLFNSMMNNIENYDIYDEVNNDERYQKLYNGNINLLKKEAIGKLIAKHIVAQIKGTETDAKLNRARRWWQKVFDYIRSIFNRVVADPYSRAAYIMLNEKINDYVNIEKGMGSITGEFFQLEEEPSMTRNPVESIIERFNNENSYWELKSKEYEELGIKKPWILEEGSSKVERYVGKPGTPYEDVVIKGRVSDAVKHHFHKMQIAKKPETDEQRKKRTDAESLRKRMGTAGHATMEDLINYHANGVGTKVEMQKNSPFTQSQFNLLFEYTRQFVQDIKNQQKQIDPNGNVIFRTEQMVRNTEDDIGGTVDVVAIFSDGSASIYDWKFVSPSKEAGYVQWKDGRYQIVQDPFAVKMDTYNLQVGQYKKTLMDNYGISKIRRSRIVPIHVRFKYDTLGNITNTITTLQIGTGAKTGSEFLEQIPVAEELTDFETINDLIVRLIARKKDVEYRLQTKNFQAGENWEKAKARKEKIEKQLRKLQVKQDIGYVLNSLKTDLKGLERRIEDNEPILANGDPNPFYMTEEELLDLNNDLIFYKNLLAVPDYLNTLDAKAREEIETIQGQVAPIIMNAQKQVEMKLRERVDTKAKARGVKGITGYNPGIDYMTGNFVTLSKQTNPFMRNLWEVVDTINFNRRKVVKQVAGEIQDLQDDVLEWGERNGYPGIKVFDLLINNNTGNFIPKFQSEFYELKDDAIRTGNWKWMKENMQKNDEYYKDKFKEWQKQKLAALKRKYGKNTKAIERDIKAWNLAYDIENHFATASVNLGGKYFLRAKDNWISEEFNTIQNIEPLRKFYEYYTEKVREIEELFGESLGPGFISNVHKEVIERGTQDGWFNKKNSDSLLENLQLREHDLSIGIRDENTGKLVRRVPKLFIRPIRDGNNNVDSSLKSRDLGKGLLLLFNAATDYKMKMDVLPEVLAMEALLAANSGVIKTIETDDTGNIITTLANNARTIFDNKDSSQMMTGFIDQYFFGNTMDMKDFKIGKLSGVKTLLAVKQYHSMVQLGIKVPVAIGAFFAGQFGLLQQAAKGKFITYKNLRKAQGALMSADPKMRALAEFFDIYQRDDSGSRANRLSANYAVRHMTNDKWFSFLATADRGIDATVLYSVSLNYGIDPDTGKVELLEKLPEGTSSLLELMEYTENPKWKGTAGNVANKALDRYVVKFPGLDPEQERQFRLISRRIADKVKGSMSEEDKALYNNNMLMRFMMHYKSWLPGIAFERFGRKRYDHILRTFDEGTWRTSFGNMGLDMTAQEALDAEVNMLQYMAALGQDIVNIGLDMVTFGYAGQTKIKEKRARAKFNEWAENNKDNPEFAEQLRNPEMKEQMFQEFVEMQRGNIRAFLMELRLTLGFALLLMAMGGDWDDDGKIDLRQSWAGRKLYNSVNRTYREIAVFTQPQEFLDSGRATGIPMINLGGDVIKAASNTMDEMRDDLLGENSTRDRTGRFYYTFKMVPGLNAFAKAFETSEQYKYSRY